MSQGQKLIASLLTVIAAALVLNVVVTGRPAAAQYGASGPVEPTVVGVSATSTGGSSIPNWRVWRAWSDGTVDTTFVGFAGFDSCEIKRVCEPQIIVPGACMSDITRDGFVATEDLLGVLADWGSCE